MPKHCFFLGKEHSFQKSNANIRRDQIKFKNGFPVTTFEQFEDFPQKSFELWLNHQVTFCLRVIVINFFLKHFFESQSIKFKIITEKDMVIVCTPPSARGMSLQPNFQKRGGALTGPQLLRGGCWENGGDFFQGRGAIF